MCRDPTAQQVYEALRAEAVQQYCSIKLPESLRQQAKITFDQFGLAGLIGVTGVSPPEHTRIYSDQRVLHTCLFCGGHYSGTRGTAYFSFKLPRQMFTYVATALAEGTGIRQAARIFDINPDQVLSILRSAGRHCYIVNQLFLQKEIEVTECQIDEIWTFVGSKAVILDEVQEYKKRSIDKDTWIWVALDAENKLILAWHVGGRTQEDAFALTKKVASILPDPPFLFTSDDLPHYREALLQTYGQLVVPKRTGKRGRPPNPYWVPPVGLRYARIIKKHKRNKVVEKRTQIIFGDKEEIETWLSERNSKLNTSYVERRNLTMRHDNRRLVRDTLCFSKKHYMLEHQLALSIAYNHFVRPHASLKSCNGRDQPNECTPMMSKGLADHPWTMEELLSYPTWNASYCQN